jgi:glycerophosphoryl diester phosphodiesterase
VTLNQYAERGATIWSPNYNTLTPTLIAEAQTAGLQVIPWTVNEPADMRQLLEWGVDGLISDRPELFVEIGR